MLPFYLVPELKFDVDAAREYYLNVKDQIWSEKYGKAANLKIWKIDSTLPFVQEFMNTMQQPDWVRHLEYFKVPAQTTLPAHIDNGRYVAMNIPIIGDFESTSLDVYDVSHISDTIDRSGAKGFGGQAKLISQVYYKVPVLVNTSIPHGTTNNTDQDRVIISVSFNEKVNIGTIIRKMLADEFWKR